MKLVLVHKPGVGVAICREIPGIGIAPLVIFENWEDFVLMINAMTEYYYEEYYVKAKQDVPAVFKTAFGEI
jgi:hypothetical protein